MSPRGPSSSPTARSASGPYNRRPSGQPKSTRQQFSACGACRMRRVRCDLKDLPVASAGPNPSCSNCKERGLKCVDEFADVKAVKLLRRGRRLQQVEAIYGKVTDPDTASSSIVPTTRLPSLIPQLQPEFFTSPFWTWFSLQRPILDPTEFPARFYAHTKGTTSLGHEGGILAMLLVVWAASFGVDERGIAMEDCDFIFSSDPASSHRDSRRTSHMKSGDGAYADTARAARKDRTESMLREILELIDFHGIMRRPTWDGVRVLLLTLPLLEDAHPLDRLMIQESTIFQAHALCTLSSYSPSVANMQLDETSLRARIYWYVHMQEGITSGLRGGRLVLNEDDLESFQSTLSSLNFSSLSSPTSSSFPSGPYVTGTGSPHSSSPDPGFRRDLHTASHPYLHMSHLFSVPLRVGAVCRKVHAILTGAKAAKRIEGSSGLNIDADGMREIWDGLDRCWGEFEGVRRGGLASGDVDPMVEQFVSGWQIFIFECHNHIRETLKQYASVSSPSSPQSAGFPATSSPPLSVSGCISARQLLAVSNRHCLRLLPSVLAIIKRHVYRMTNVDMQDSAGLFRWDTGLVRDGVFFAGFLIASVGDEAFARASRSPGAAHMLMKHESSDSSSETVHLSGQMLHSPGDVIDAEEGVQVCLSAIGQMRWAFSKSDEREDNIRRVWQETQLFQQQQPQPQQPAPQQQQPTPLSSSPVDYTRQQLHFQNAYETGLTPLVVVPHGTRIESAPTTACSSSSGGSGWPSYTPPGTGTSGSSMSSHGGGGSPLFSAMPPGTFKPADMDVVPTDAFYPVTSNDLDPFSFNAASTTAAPIVPAYPHRSPVTGSHGPSPEYLDFATGGSSSVLAEEVGSFPDGCNSFYP